MWHPRTQLDTNTGRHENTLSLTQNVTLIISTPARNKCTCRAVVDGGCDQCAYRAPPSKASQTSTRTGSSPCGRPRTRWRGPRSQQAWGHLQAGGGDSEPLDSWLLQ